jgi:hypothetical protein
MWQQFEKSALISDDTLNVICKRCEHVLNHSSTESDIITTKNHLKFKKCRKIEKVEDLPQLILIKSWKKWIILVSFNQRLLRKLLKTLRKIKFFFLSLRQKITRKITKNLRIIFFVRCIEKLLKKLLKNKHVYFHYLFRSKNSTMSFEKNFQRNFFDEQLQQIKISS